MTETVRISKVVPKDGNKPFKVYDGNDVEYVTWDDTLGAKAANLTGEQVTLEVEVKVTEKDGKTFTNRLLKGVEKVDVAPANVSSDEPSINTAKQIVIIRQSSWNQANQIYAHAVELYRNAHPGVVDVDVPHVHTIAWSLFAPTVTPDPMNIGVLAGQIERRVRADYFPMSDEEIPF